MGAYRYCDCNHPLPKPTVNQDLIDGQICPGCGDRLNQDQSCEEWLVELAERLDNMEKYITKDNE